MEGLELRDDARVIGLDQVPAQLICLRDGHGAKGKEVRDETGKTENPSELEALAVPTQQAIVCRVRGAHMGGEGRDGVATLGGQIIYDAPHRHNDATPAQMSSQWVVSCLSGPTHERCQIRGSCRARLCQEKCQAQNRDRAGDEKAGTL